MKNTLLTTLLVATVIISSCKTEIVDCTPGNLETYSVGINLTNVSGAVVTRYLANSNNKVDSEMIRPESVGSDTLKLFTMTHGYDYKLQLNDSTTYFFSKITLSGIKQQSYKTSIINTKAYGCTELIVGYTLNGTAYDISNNRYNRIYIR